MPLLLLKKKHKKVPYVIYAFVKEHEKYCSIDQAHTTYFLYTKISDKKYAYPSLYHCNLQCVCNNCSFKHTSNIRSQLMELRFPFIKHLNYTPGNNTTRET